jgi:hypothetical protein
MQFKSDRRGVMKIVRISLIATALLMFGCSNNAQPANHQAAQPQLTEEQKAANRANGLAENYVAVPELKDVMDAMIMEQADVLWSVSGPEDAPKDEDGWRKIDHAAIAMIETMKFLKKSHLTKDQGEWQTKSNQLIDAATKARQAIKEKNPDKLLEAGGDVEGACSSCHKLYYAEG